MAIFYACRFLNNEYVKSKMFINTLGNIMELIKKEAPESRELSGANDFQSEQGKGNENEQQHQNTSQSEFDINEFIQDSEDLRDLQSLRYLKQLKESIIDPTESVKAPPVCLSIMDKNICTLGNFSMIQGKAKSRKTFFITIALAAATNNSYSLNIFGSLPESQKAVLYFDTEQSKYHANKTVNRVCRLVSIVSPPNFTAYGLRKYPPVERTGMIETAIYNTPELGFVVIDGIRDLVTSINDEEQATSMSSNLLRWTEEKNIHIMVVLHENKNDTNPRGHLGSELLNKAETVLSVTKDESKDISVVEVVVSRDIEPEKFAFRINSIGLPELTDLILKNSGKPNQTEVSDEVHLKVIKEVFKIKGKLLYAELLRDLKYQYEKSFQIKYGDNKIKDKITWFKREGIIDQNTSKLSKEKFYYLTNNQDGDVFFNEPL